MRKNAIKGFKISPKEANKLFYLDKEGNICISTEQLKNCNISDKSKKMLLSTFESP